MGLDVSKVSFDRVNRPTEEVREWLLDYAVNNNWAINEGYAFGSVDFEEIKESFAPEDVATEGQAERAERVGLEKDIFDYFTENGIEDGQCLSLDW
jgi:hypothetical protein